MQRRCRLRCDFIGWLSVALLVGCSQIPEPSTRLASAMAPVQAAAWQGSVIHTADFALQSFHPRELNSYSAADGTGARLTIYIEGDGLAWRNRYTPAKNPTPTNPVALALALRHPDRQVAYLARPCQYVPLAGESHCLAQSWTHDRFSRRAVAAMNAAVDTLKTRARASALHLIGYSGGGVIAAILAAQRSDVARLTTLAAPLDTDAWTAHHRVSALASAINPAGLRDALARVPQTHFAGSDDTRVPPAVLATFADGFAPGLPTVRVETVADFDHNCCWVDHWPALLDLSRQHRPTRSPPATQNLDLGKRR